MLLNGFFVMIMEINVYKFKQVDDVQMDLQNTWNQQFQFEKVLCTSEFWILNSVAEILQIVLFIIVTKNITKQVNSMIEFEKKVYGYKEGHF
jgi:galactitol-specific phosphotransferase system IIC component